MKTVHLGSISQECKYANHYSTHGTNTNVEEECMHVALLRGRSDDGGCVWGGREQEGRGKKVRSTKACKRLHSDTLFDILLLRS